MVVIFVNGALSCLHDLVDQVFDDVWIFALASQLQNAPMALAQIRAQDAEIGCIQNSFSMPFSTVPILQGANLERHSTIVIYDSSND